MDMLNGQRRVCRLQLFRIKVDSETYVADTSSECQEQNVKIDNSDNQDQEPVVEPENEPDSSKLEFFEDYFGDVDAEMDQDYVPEADDDSEVEENSTETDVRLDFAIVNIVHKDSFRRNRTTWSNSRSTRMRSWRSFRK